MEQKNSLDKSEVQNPTSENLQYIPQSDACVSVDTITPSEMRYDMLKAIATIDRRVNGVDEYVAEKLGYIVGNASVEDKKKGIKYSTL
jgi:phosphoglycerate dehydrogenase-like enzyme